MMACCLCTAIYAPAGPEHGLGFSYPPTSTSHVQSCTPLPVALHCSKDEYVCAGLDQPEWLDSNSTKAFAAGALASAINRPTPPVNCSTISPPPTFPSTPESFLPCFSHPTQARQMHRGRPCKQSAPPPSHQMHRLPTLLPSQLNWQSLCSYQRDGNTHTLYLCKSVTETFSRPSVIRPSSSSNSVRWGQ